MAELLESPVVQNEDLDPPEPTLEDTVTPEPTPEPEPEELPEKFQGKSPKELVSIIEESQKMIGKQSQEVGELRKTFDDYIQTQLTTAPKEPEEDIDFFTDPDRAINKAIESHPVVQEAKKASADMQKTAALNALKTQHPDMGDILKNDGFLEWANGSNMRTRLFKQADQQYDYEAADELFSMWKDRQSMVEQTATVEKKARKQQVRQAATGSGRSSDTAPSRKVYRRTDLIKLHINDPDRYDALQPEIQAAYAEGRVK